MLPNSAKEPVAFFTCTDNTNYIFKVNKTYKIHINKENQRKCLKNFNKYVHNKIHARQFTT